MNSVIIFQFSRILKVFLGAPAGPFGYCSFSTEMLARPKEDLQPAVRFTFPLDDVLKFKKGTLRILNTAEQSFQEVTL